ncbi:MAG: hypothetical protein Q9170_005249 [Blastenia crenularia]
MAPINVNSVDDQVKDVIQDLFQIQVAVQQYAGDQTRNELVRLIPELSNSLSRLSHDASTLSTQIPPEIIDYVDEGRNPDIYTREFVELVQKNNQYLKGKSEALSGFRDALVDEMVKAWPEMKKDVEDVLQEGADLGHFFVLYYWEDTLVRGVSPLLLKEIDTSITPPALSMIQQPHEQRQHLPESLYTYSRMPAYRNITISLVSQFDILNIPEYAPPALDDPFSASPALVDNSLVSCYVPIYPLSQFWLSYSISAPHPPKALYYFKLFIDGACVVSWGCGEENGFKGKTMYGLYDSGERWMGEPGIDARVFGFADEATAHRPMNNSLAQVIEVRVYRARGRKRTRPMLEDFKVVMARSGNQRPMLPIKGSKSQSQKTKGGISMLNAAQLEALGVTKSLPSPRRPETVARGSSQTDEEPLGSIFSSTSALSTSENGTRNSSSPASVSDISPLTIRGLSLPAIPPIGLPAPPASPRSPLKRTISPTFVSHSSTASSQSRFAQMIRRSSRSPSPPKNDENIRPPSPMRIRRTAIFGEEQDGTNGYWSENERDVIPACRITPNTARDVAKAVGDLAHARCRFAIRGSGHMFWAGAANIQNSVTIDLSRMNDIVLSEDRQTVSIGPGVRWQDVYTALDPMNLSVVGGRAGTVGVAGLTLGGKFSLRDLPFSFSDWQRRRELLLRSEVVLASGQVVTASTTENKDLYKALRGGGNNFGVVTKFNFRTFEQGKIWAGFVVHPPSTTTENLLRLQNFTAVTGIGLDNYATINQLHTYNSNGRSEIVNIVVYTKPESDPDVLRPFTNLYPQISNDLRITSLSDIVKEGKHVLDMADIAFSHIQRIEGFSAFFSFQPITKEIIAHAADYGGNSLGLDFDRNIFWLNYGVSYSNTADDDTVEAVTTGFFEAAKQYTQDQDQYEGSLVMNYAMPTQNVIASYGPKNVAALKAASRKYDPSQVFQELVPGGFKLP